MADLSVIKLPNNTSYNLKDSTARSALVELVDNGAKNIADANKLQASILGVTITQDFYDKNIITMSGTNTGAITLYLWGTNSTPLNITINEDYVVAPAITTTNISYIIYYIDSNGTAKFQTVGTEPHVIPSGSTLKYLYLQQSTVNKAISLSVKIIVCPKVLWEISQKYVPYALPNHKITTALVELVDSGDKNKLNFTLDFLKVLNPYGTWSSNSYARRGVTFTVNDDKTITVNGTATGGDAWLDLTTSASNYSGFIGSGCPSGGDTNKYAIQYGSNAYDYGNSVICGSGAVGIVIRSGQTMNNAVFKPMVCTEAEFIASKNYVQYKENSLSIPTISNLDTLEHYVDGLSKGYHVAFIASSSRPSDAPIADNCFVEIFVYSSNTASIRIIPNGTTYFNQIYIKSKVSGTWRGWYKFTGTAVS